MSKLRVHSFSISIDGYGAGPNQDLEHLAGYLMFGHQLCNAESVS